MTKEQFNTLLQSPSTINLNMVKGLEEITSQFPYFSNAHLLLAKQYQGHENIRYESYLRKAAAYAADRTLLYRLIKTEPEAVIHIVAEPEEQNTAFPSQESQTIHITEASNDSQLSVEEEIENEIAESEIVEENIIDEKPEINPEEVKSIVQEKNETPAPSHEESFSQDYFAYTGESVGDSVPEHEKIQDTISNPKVTESNIIEDNQESLEIPQKENPIDIIERRIEELARKSEEKREELPVNEISEEDDNTESENIAETQWSVEVEADESDEQPVSQASEITTDSGNKTEETTVVEPQENKPREVHTFLEWLKMKDMPVLAVERNRDYFNTGEQLRLDLDGKPIKQQDQLIENFILTEPRIVPAKSEFYSAGNMARQSVIEHADLITETLARIYSNQGNIPKAIDAYRRLSLKIPEKSSYFAALIKELEERAQE